MARHTRFDHPLASPWRTHITGAGTLAQTHTLRLINSSLTSRAAYTNAQIDDYQGLARHRFPWRPPLRLTLRARFSHPGAHESMPGPTLTGTAGFGFWNDPFAMSERRLPALPRAIWFPRGTAVQHETAR